MIITRLQGGLGNQMFQYALGRNLSLKNKTQLLLDNWKLDSHNLRSYVLGDLAIHAQIATAADVAQIKPQGILAILDFCMPATTKRYVVEKNPDHFNPKILSTGSHAYLDGHWQSEKYFIEIADVIRADFQLKEKPDATFSEFIAKIHSVNSVSLHIRRSDYLTTKHQSIYAQIPLSYYDAAIKKMGPGIELFVFSDDIEWVKTNLKVPAEIPLTFVSDKGFSVQQELFIMSQCKHNIIANSTFSWWAAWLNTNPNKLIITPAKWFMDGRNESDLLPEAWTKL